MRKLLFLDFDGVLHSETGQHFERRELFEKYLHQMPQVEVIISSSWREDMTLTELQGIFTCSVRTRINAVTPVLDEGFLPGGRQKEIELFLKDNNLDANNATWVALDDISVFFTKGYTNLIVVDPSIGFSERDGEQLLAWYQQALFIERMIKTKAVLDKF